MAGGEIPLRSYEELSPDGAVNELLLRRVLYGISCRNYESAAEAIPGAIGLSSSTVSRGFVQASAAKLRQMQERDLSAEDVVAIFLDGKMFADATMVVALGITITGDKRFLGFVETSTENEQVLTPFLRSLMERGLDISEGVLVIVDGGKGLRAAVKRAFGNRALVQRCQWHKRENVVSYLSKTEQAAWRKRLQRAYQRPEYNEARAALEQLHGELEERNQSAATSLEEGLEETLTLHRLGVYGVLGRSFKTTNCLESVNALVEERCAKVDHWKNSSQRQRWLATALIDIEPRLRKVIGYRHLPKLREALRRELKIEAKTSTRSKKKVAWTNREPWRVSTKNGLDSLVEQAALFGSLSRGGRLDEIVDAESVFACVLEDGEALTVQVLLRDRDPQIGNGFHGLTMGCVTVHASELFGQNEHLFLTEPCRSLDFPFDPRLLRHVSPIERKNVILYGSI